MLEWITITEINNDYFTIERAIDGINFTEIGVIDGEGSSNSEIHYQFTDNNLTENTYYYRLKQTDFNGSFSYSNTIALSSDLANNVNYNNNSKQLEIGDIKNGVVIIYNLQGQIVNSFNTSNSSVYLNLPKGMYLISVNVKSKLFSKKIVVY